MAIIKLIPGQKIHLTVDNVEQVEGNYGPQFMFTGKTPDDAAATLYLNVSTAERQLERIGFTIHSVLGQTVEIARTEKNGTKYTDINRVSGTPLATAGQKASNVKQAYSSGPYIEGIDGPREETGAPPSGMERVQGFDKLFAAYDLCHSHAMTIARKMDDAKIGSSPESVAAIAATLLIQADRQGLTR